MSKAALIIIGIVYGISLLVAHVVRHPPDWAVEISVTAEGVRTFRLLGHEVTFELEVKRAPRREDPACTALALYPVLRDGPPPDGALDGVTSRAERGVCR